MVQDGTRVSDDGKEEADNHEMARAIYLLGKLCSEENHDAMNDDVRKQNDLIDVLIPTTGPRFPSIYEVDSFQAMVVLDTTSSTPMYDLSAVQNKLVNTPAHVLASPQCCSTPALPEGLHTRSFLRLDLQTASSAARFHIDAQLAVTRASTILCSNRLDQELD
jgi:hypothetical protein